VSQRTRQEKGKLLVTLENLRLTTMVSSQYQSTKKDG
jgi:hypothetical protein